MKPVMVILLLLSISAFAEDGEYCEKGERNERMREGFDVRFCLGTKAYMEAFANALDEEGIAHYVYGNGDISYRSGDRDRVQEIGDTLLYEYIFTKDEKPRKGL